MPPASSKTSSSTTIWAFDLEIPRLFVPSIPLYHTLEDLATGERFENTRHYGLENGTPLHAFWQDDVLMLQKDGEEEAEPLATFVRTMAAQERLVVPFVQLSTVRSPDASICRGVLRREGLGYEEVFEFPLDEQGETWTDAAVPDPRAAYRAYCFGKTWQILDILHERGGTLTRDELKKATQDCDFRFGDFAGEAKAKAHGLWTVSEDEEGTVWYTAAEPQDAEMDAAMAMMHRDARRKRPRDGDDTESEEDEEAFKCRKCGRVCARAATLKQHEAACRILPAVAVAAPIAPIAADEDTPLAAAAPAAAAPAAAAAAPAAAPAAAAAAPVAARLAAAAPAAAPVAARLAAAAPAPAPPLPDAMRAAFDTMFQALDVTERLLQRTEADDEAVRRAYFNDALRRHRNSDDFLADPYKWTKDLESVPMEEMREDAQQARENATNALESVRQRLDLAVRACREVFDYPAEAAPSAEA
jgi:hypothetical protein